MSDAPAIASGGSTGVVAPSRPMPPKPRGKKKSFKALFFLLPAILLLAALVVYPIFATVVRSLFDRSGDSFIGLDNYSAIWQTEGTRTALKNNLIWVLFAPTITTALGLVFAVLAERVRWQTAFKLAVFMPMAISFLAAGVIFRLVYETDPDRGLANAALTTIAETFDPSGQYEGARPTNDGLLRSDIDRTSIATFAPGQQANFGFVGLTPDRLPGSAEPAMVGASSPGSIIGTVWLDFAPGGGGAKGVPDSNERGMPDIEVSLVNAAGTVVATDTTDETGSYSFSDIPDGQYSVRLDQKAFSAAYAGVNWLGESLVTASVIAAFVWIWAGFAMIVIGAGLAAIPRDVLEAARVDGANEWQVFQRVTVPLLAPVLVVVLITLVINVLKVFDLVFIIPPGDVQDNATVIALEMWRVSFGGAQDQGLGSAISVVLFLLVIPAMAINIKRFRSAG